ncbi:50S ribosomal protein L21 [Candidatus Babeliales bacterium]|nr:50S ribosomal protein L21 [Candidatus Babeliales bacterium]
MKQEQSILSKYAIIQTGGKQYQAIPGKTLAIEKLEGEAGDSVEIKEVLLRKQDGKIELGKPFVNGAAVKASIIKHIKDTKKIAFIFKRRKKCRTKKGHRQPLTVIRVEEV